jgi:hypothetical protein
MMVRPGLFSRKSYDRDAPAYGSVPSELPHSDTDEEGPDDEVLREEEEREKLLAGGNGLFGSIGRSGGGVKIGKKVKGGRRKKASDVAVMMGGKRLGMEDGGEYGIGSGDEEGEEERSGEEELWGEKEALEKKVTNHSLSLLCDVRKLTRRETAAETVAEKAYRRYLAAAVVPRRIDICVSQTVGEGVECTNDAAAGLHEWNPRVP